MASASPPVDTADAESTEQKIFKKLKEKEDARKEEFWYRMYTFTVDPGSKARRSWDICLMMLVLYSGFSAPYKAVFERAPGAVKLDQDTLDWGIDTLFYFDIVLNFFTGYDNGYQVVTERKAIVKQYVGLQGRDAGFFWIDLIATVQWDLLLFWITDGGANVAWLALLKMLKVARMLRFGRLITRVTQHMQMHTGYVEAGKFFIYVLYVAHILACLFFLWSELFDCRRPTCSGTAIAPPCRYTSGTDGCPAGCIDDGATCSGTATAQSCDVEQLMRREDCPDGCQYTSYMGNDWDLATHAPLKELRCLDGTQDLLNCEVDVVDIDLDDPGQIDCTPTSWRHSYSVAGVTINQMRPLSQWTQSFYWAITTMSTIGYGDRGPENESEIIFTIAAELIGLAFFALLIQTINNLKDVIGLKEKQQKEVKNKLVDQMKRNNLKDELIAKAVKFLNFQATSKAGRAFLRDDEDFQVLSPALQREILQATNYPLVQEVKIFGHSKEDQIEMDSVQAIFEEANCDNGEEDGEDEHTQALDQQEIKTLVIEKLGVSEEYFTEERLKQAMERMDSSKDGRVELGEFQNWWYMQRFHRPRMKPCPDSLLLEIAEHLECIPASPGDIIVPLRHYGDSFFVLQAGAVIKRAVTGSDRVGQGETDKQNKGVKVAHDDNDPFFGLQAVLPDNDFEMIRPMLTMMEIVVAEESYVECLAITRLHLRRALEKVENLSKKNGRLDRLIRTYTDMYMLESKPNYEDDPARIVEAELALQSQSLDPESSQVAKDLEEIQHLRRAAWEWTNVDGKRMRGCELLQEHAKKLTQEVHGKETSTGGPPEEVVAAAVRRRARAKGDGIEVPMWQEFEDVRHKVDMLEKKVDTALLHAVRTNSILEALAKQQGIAVCETFDKTQGVETDSTVDDNDSASDNHFARRTSRSSPVPAPLPARSDRRSDQRAAKQNADTRPSPIRRKAEATGMIISSPHP